MNLYSDTLLRLGVPHAFAPAGDAVVFQPTPTVELRYRSVPQQVHGVRVVHSVRLGAHAADGAWENRVGAAVGVRSADCVPVLLAAPQAGRVAAIHAGWRGVAANIVERFVRRQQRLAGIAPHTWHIALGPAAGGDAYEVGPEVAMALGLPPRRGPVDLRQLLTQRLRALGVRRVEVVGPCTITDAAWASYRRQGTAAGRNWAWIGRSY